MEKVAWIAIAGMVLAVMVGTVKREISMWISIVTCILIILFGIQDFQHVVELLHNLTDSIGIDEIYIRIILKMLGIAYLAEFTAAICRDAGQGAIAGQVDFFGRMSMVLVSVPVLQSLLETIVDIF